MPKLTLVLGRETLKVYDLDQPVIKIGRVKTMDIVIDNVGVSRNQAEIHKDGERWLVRDMGSSNGTFVNGGRLSGDHVLQAGDEISMGKFSVFFEKAVAGERHTPTPARETESAFSSSNPAHGTIYLRADELEKMQKTAAQKRQAQILWEAKGQRGTHYLSGSSALIGRDDLCDLKVPAGPRHHVLVMRMGDGYEVRNLCWLRGMKVKGLGTRRVKLADGDVIEIGGITLTFKDELR